MHISISSSSQQAYALQVTSDETEHVNVYTTQELKAFHTHFVVPLTRSCVAVPGGYTHPLLKQLVFKLPEFGNIEEWVALLSALPLELQSTVEFNSFFLNKPPPTPAKDRNGLHPGKLILRSDSSFLNTLAGDQVRNIQSRETSLNTKLTKNSNAFSSLPRTSSRMVKPENILPKSVSALSLKDDTEKPNKKKTHSPTTISPTSAGNLISPPRISTPSDSSKSSGNTETLFRQVSGNTAIPLRQTSLFKQLPVSPVSAKSPTTSEQDVEDTGKRSPNPIVYGARKSSLFDRNSVDYYQLLAQGRKKSVDASHEDNDNNRDSISPSYEQFVSGLAEKLGIDLNGMPVQDSVAKKQNNPYASDVTVLDFAPNEGQTPREKLNSHIGSKHSKASTDLTDLCDLVAGHRTSMAPSHVSVAESDVTELEISTLGRPSRRRPSLETRVGYIGSDRRTSMHFPRRPSIDEETEPVSASTARKMDILPSIPSRSDSKVWKRVTLPPSPPLAVKTINIIGAHKRNGSSPLPSSEQLVVKTAQLTRARTIGRNDDSTARVSPTKDIPPDSMEFKISIDGARIVRFRGSKQISYAEFIDLLSSKLGKLAILNSQWMLKDGQVVIKSILHSTMSIDTSRGWDELVTRVGPETMHLNVLLEMQ